MLAIGTILAGVMIGGAVAGQGADAAMNADTLRNNIQATHAKTQELKASFKKMFFEEKANKAQLHSTINDAMNEILKMSAAMKLSKEQFMNQRKQLENVGVFIVAVLVLLLGLKHFGLLDDIRDEIFGRTFQVPLTIKVTPQKAASIGYQI